MKLREALITQAPSLELHRAAQAEIARLDAQITQLQAMQPTANKHKVDIAIRRLEKLLGAENAELRAGVLEVLRFLQEPPC